MAGAAAAIALAFLLTPTAARAQESRADELAAARAEKATDLHEYTPDALERRLDFVQRQLSVKRPVYAFIGSVFEGGGLAMGPGFRYRFGDSGAINAHAAWSIRNYRGAVATVALPKMYRDRVSVAVRVEDVHAPTVAFYGIGSGTTDVDRRSFALDQFGTGATARFNATSHIAAGGSIDWLSTSAEAPSLDVRVAALNPDYARTSAFAEFDTRTSPGYTQRGTFVRTSFTDYRQSNGSTSSFQRADADAQQFIPLMHDSRVIALRAAASTTFVANGQTVPFFLLPDLGGHDALRGYSSWRFRDNSRLLVSGEYRWSAGPLVDMSLFADAGTVAPRLADVAVRDFRASYGIGFTVHTPSTTVTRLEVARSKEGLGLLISFGPSF
jgi:hypothetical protein